MKRKFTLFGHEYAFTHIFDDVCRYDFGGLRFDDGVLVSDTRQYWHKIGFGIYKRSNHWLFVGGV